jgi:hypothetical protein
MTIVATFWLALAKVGCCPPPTPPPLTADYHVLLCLERGLAVVQFGQLGLNGCSLTDKFTSLLCEPVLGVNL